jgi:peptidyl-prolyl cis-trans isomerase B (cyclophilin B)
MSLSRRLAVAALALALPLGASAQQPATAPSAPQAVVETEAGSFLIRLRPDLAPSHVRHFVKTAKAGGYDGTAFHRLIPGGVIQGGDPLSKDPQQTARYGTGGLGLLQAEFSDAPFIRGVVAAVRKSSSKDSGGSQFFICLTDQPALHRQYTVFGEVASGMEVVDKLAETPVEGDKPTTRVVVRRVTIREGGEPPRP